MVGKKTENKAVCRTKGGLNTKANAIVDGLGNPVALDLCQYIGQKSGKIRGCPERYSWQNHPGNDGGRNDFEHALFFCSKFDT